MVLSSEVHTVELIYAGQDVAVTETATSFVNERQKVEVSLEKALETNELFGIGNNGEIKISASACSPMRSLCPQAALPFRKTVCLKSSRLMKRQSDRRD